MKKTFFCAVFTFASMCVSIPTSHAQHISTGSMKATIKIMLRQSEDKKRGPNGRAFIITKQEVPLNGVSSGKCLNVGPGNPGVELDAESSSFDSFYSRAYFAYENNKTVFIRYDNSFGPGADCKLTSIEIVE